MMAATDSFSKIISNLAGTVGSSSAGVMKTVVTNVSTSAAEKKNDRNKLHQNAQRQIDDAHSLSASFSRVSCKGTSDAHN